MRLILLAMLAIVLIAPMTFAQSWFGSYSGPSPSFRSFTFAPAVYYPSMIFSGYSSFTPGLYAPAYYYPQLNRFTTPVYFHQPYLSFTNTRTFVFGPNFFTG